MRFHVLTFALAQATLTFAVCPEGQVGVGTGQLCNFTSVMATGAGGDCGSQDGRIYANDCGIIATTTSVFTEGFCDATWDNGAGVECDGNGTPVTVITQGGNFGNCQPATNFGETQCTPPAALFGPGIFSVEFCCSRI